MTDSGLSPLLHTEYIALAEVVPAVRNPKRHDEAEIAASIRRFGFVEPILMDERTGRLIAGHGRLEVLMGIERSGEAPPAGIVVDGGWRVPVLRGWSSVDDGEAEALLVAVNQLPAKGGWDDRMLADLLSRLPSFEGTGFVQPDLDALLEALSPTYDDGTGLSEEKSYAERGDQYRNQQVRSMVFDYPLEDYEAVLAAATSAREAFGVESNAELFEAMLRDWDANPWP